MCFYHNFILSSRNCDKSATLDWSKKTWQCQKVTCRQKKRECSFNESVFKRIPTFFEKVHPDIETLQVFVTAFMRPCFLYTSVEEELGTSDHSLMGKKNLMLTFFAHMGGVLQTVVHLISVP